MAKEKKEDLKESGSDGAGLENKLDVVSAPKLTVVFPYFKAKAQGKELLYAMRALERNFREDFQIVVIGDREDWFSDEVIPIDAVRISDNPQIDTINKIKLAIADELVSDDFIWMNDDIYCVGPTLLADIQILTAAGKLQSIPGTKSIYEQNRNNTIDAIALLGDGKLRIHNYDTHTPFCFNKSKLVTLFEEVGGLNEDGLLLPSIYFNAYYPDHVPTQLDGKSGNYLLRLVTPSPDKAVFGQFVQDKKFLNNAETGYAELLVNFLESKFPTPSRFEK